MSSVLASEAPPVFALSTALGARTVGEMFLRRVARSASLPAFYEKRKGVFTPTAWVEAEEAARRIARGFLRFAKTGERVAILGPTKLPWAIADLGAQLAGLVSFGIYPKQSPEQIRYLLRDSEARIVFVDGDDEIQNLIEAARGIPSLRAIIPWTHGSYEAFRSKDTRVLSPSFLEEEALSRAEVQRIQSQISPDDTAILIYTSGTTGPPKGAMISHRNILSLLSFAIKEQGWLQNDISLNFLPMAHAAERIVGFYGRIAAGMAGAYAESLSTVLDDLKLVRPTIFGGVPRIFEKAHARIMGEIEKKGPSVRKAFDWALSLGIERTQLLLEGKPIPPR
ncbi:MAG: AMP-binding protein, partial [Deltaproteobacteria bacterium]|nr:AMP-binding protein [Deltaproteobacteria bacterium]